MNQRSSALSSGLSARLYGQLEELVASQTSLTDRLFRCRQILEDIFKAVTDNTGIAFTGLYARMLYAYETSVTPSEKNEQLQLLRLLTNKVIHKDDFDFGEQDFASAVLILDDTLCFLSGGSQQTGAAVSDFLQRSGARQLIPFATAASLTVEHVYGMVTGWKCSGAKSSGRFIEISCRTSEGNQITATLWEKSTNQNEGRLWTRLDKVLWKYCNISFYHLSSVHGMANRFQSTPQTQVIVEPDFLVDVSSIADCFQNQDYFPEFFVINKFFSEPINAALAKGKCVNSIFDELVGDPKRLLQEVFSAYLEANRHYVFALGEQAWQKIYDEILADHYAQLKAMASEFSRQSCQLEPSFISLRYGLHGRLDLISLPAGQEAKYSILELKSGAAPAYDVWKSHQMQVVGYNLILREVFGSANIANSSIFYSRSSAKPLRHVVNNVILEQDFLMCRNRIIGLLFKLATEPKQIVSWMKGNTRTYPGKFLTEKSDRLRHTLNALKPEELKWFTDKLQFIFRETWAIKTGAFAEFETGNYGFSSLWMCSPVEKKQQYRIIDNLWIEEVAEDRITFHRQEESILTNLRLGDIIVLYKQALPVNRQQLIRGKVGRLDNDRIEIVTRCRIKQESQFDKYTLWAVEPDLMESALYCGVSSVYSCLVAGPAVRSKILGYAAPVSSPRDSSSVLSLREDVKESLRGMIRADDYYLVQGPPGTGKTSILLMQYISYLMAETGLKALIVSYTNRAVDEICACLDRENHAYFRFGNFKPGLGDAAGPGYGTARIFVSTCHTFLSVSPDLLDKITIDEMIVDEASQILEHHIIGLMARIPKTILIGDQNQLPPVILQQTDRENQSILEKLVNNAGKKFYADCFSMLTRHYRMHNDIARLVAQNYRDRLVSESQRQHSDEPWLSTRNDFLRPILAKRVVWIETPASYQSKADTLHANWISRFVEELSCQLDTDEICSRVGIISPFRAQAQCIISTLGNKYSNLTVDTVERFQGSERDCIIMSYPLRYQHELTMVQSVNRLGTVDRKLNVALSRAREQLIILGCSKVLTHSEFFHRVFDLIRQHGTVISLNGSGQ